MAANRTRMSLLAAIYCFNLATGWLPAIFFALTSILKNNSYEDSN